MLGLYKSLAFIGKQKKIRMKWDFHTAPFHTIDWLVRRKKGRSRTKNRPGSEGCGKFRLFERELPRDHDPTVVG